LNFLLRTTAFFHKSVNKYFHYQKKMERIPTMLFVVAAALTNEKREILLQKRPQGGSMAGLWEFPGGKVEEGETPESALIRELREELGIEVDAANLHPFTFASEDLGGRHLLLLLYLCRQWTGEPNPLHAEETVWVTAPDMRGLDMPPADAPFIDMLEKLL
jgi:8-oxo-dGTP diphosphatase